MGNCCLDCWTPMHSVLRLVYTGDAPSLWLVHAGTRCWFGDPEASPGRGSDYAIEFQTLATDSGWEGRVQFDSFIHGLSERVKDELLTREFPEDLHRLISLAIRIDSQQEDRRRYSRPRSPPRVTRSWPRASPPPDQPPPRRSPGAEPKPMMVEWSRLSKEERDPVTSSTL